MNAVLQPRLDFRPMRLEDVDAIMAVEKTIYPFPWTAGNFIDSLTSGYSAWICREDGLMVGYAVMMLVLDEAHLLNIGIVAERQRAGLGGTLLDYLFQVARAAGARRMLLEVRPSNVSGCALYRHCGFVEIGRRRGYYPGHRSREDAIVMEREL
ncbi:MAG: ribosomal protein S18-alanine N-acetyltransferase [Rhodocyclaceae bacterium]|nr:ribosomal protein S18-alanine N-acetyltransferase [Rhodocyclaceae bacterium]